MENLNELIPVLNDAGKYAWEHGIRYVMLSHLTGVITGGLCFLVGLGCFGRVWSLHRNAGFNFDREGYWIVLAVLFIGVGVVLQCACLPVTLEPAGFLVLSFID